MIDLYALVRMHTLIILSWNSVEDIDVMDFLKALEILPQIAFAPLAIMAYIIAFGSWMYYLNARRSSTTLVQVLDKLDAKDRAAAIVNVSYKTDHISGLPAQDRAKVVFLRHKVVAFFGTLVAIVLIIYLFLSKAENTARLENEKQILTIKGETVELRNKIEADRSIASFHSFLTESSNIAAQMSVQNNPTTKELANSLTKKLIALRNSMHGKPLSEENEREVRTSEAMTKLALGQFDKVLELIPESDASQMVDAAAAHCKMRADALFGKGRWQDALKEYKQVNRILPHELISAFRIGSCLYMLEDYPPAITTFTQFITAVKGNTDTGTKKLVVELTIASHVNIGAAHQKLGRFKEAVEEYTAAIKLIENEEKLRPVPTDRAIVYANRADAQKMLHLPKESELDLKKVEEIIGSLGNDKESAPGYDALTKWVADSRANPTKLAVNRPFSCGCCHAP
ncbi:MAG: hypothetical protein QM703_13575 [Gemmatales bacterium]